MNEYAPLDDTLTGPVGCTSPYASFTANAAVLELMPDKLSAIVPEIVTVTIFPFGGQRVAGLAEAVITGGVLSILTVIVFAASTFPALSVPKKVKVVVPSVEIVTVVVLPVTVLEPVCAPVSDH